MKTFDGLGSKPQRSVTDDILDIGTLTVNKTISSADSMLIKGWEQQYFAVGADALRLIVLGMILAGKREFKSILDLPCGHGRVMRYLKARFPEARLTACDVDREGVDFCAKTFGAKGVYSHNDVRNIVINEKFDLIWVGSLLTHVRSTEWHPFLEFFSNHLEEDGILIFTTHGRYTEKLIQDRTHSYGIDEKKAANMLKQYKSSGFAYLDYPQAKNYGVSVATPSWVMDQIGRHRELKLLSFTEMGWADHQDVVTCLHRANVFPLLSPWHRGRKE
jgi:SAM-dependent methyltransferase